MTLIDSLGKFEVILIITTIILMGIGFVFLYLFFFEVINAAPPLKENISRPSTPGARHGDIYE